MAPLSSKSSLYSMRSSSSSTRQHHHINDDFSSIFGVPSSSPSRRQRRSTTAAFPSRSIGGFGPLPPADRRKASLTSSIRRSGSHSAFTARSSSSSSNRSSTEFNSVSMRTEPAIRASIQRGSSVDMRQKPKQLNFPPPTTEIPEIEPVTEPEPDSEPERHRPPVQVCGQASCAVEGDLFRNGDTVARLPCGHVFHRDCIQPFIFHNRNGGYCPLDGVPVPRERATLLPVWRVSHSSTTASPEIRTVPSNVCVDPPSPMDIGPPRESELLLKKWTPQFRESCAIDGTRFKEGELCVRIKRCGHVFHARCVSHTIATGQFKRCPIDGEKIAHNDLRNIVVDTSSCEHRPTLRDVAAAMNSTRLSIRDSNQNGHITRMSGARKFESARREPKVRRALLSFRRSANHVCESTSTSESSSQHSAGCAAARDNARRTSQIHSTVQSRPSASTVFSKRNRLYYDSRRLSKRHESL